MFFHSVWKQPCCFLGSTTWYGIYKGHYLQELIARYASDSEVGSLPVPDLPDWCLEEEEVNSGGEEESRGENGRGARPKRREFTNEVRQPSVVGRVMCCVCLL